MEEQDVLHMVDGRHTIQDLVDRCPLGEFDTYRILYDLLDRGLIEEVRVESSERADVADDRRATVRAAVLIALVVGFVLFPYEVDGVPLEPADFLSGFGHEALIAICSLVLIGKGLETTGAGGRST